jgi:hypothetical protein
MAEDSSSGWVQERVAEKGRYWVTRHFRSEVGLCTAGEDQARGSESKD